MPDFFQYHKSHAFLSKDFSSKPFLRIKYIADLFLQIYKARQLLIQVFIINILRVVYLEFRSLS